MSSERFFNRDLSLLAFNRRVLAQASDPAFPLLERVRFVSIFSSNMDEFFMKRIGYLKRLHAKGSSRAGADNVSPAEVLLRIRAEIASLFEERSRVWKNELIPQLGQAGVELLSWDQLSEAEHLRAQEHFLGEVFPVLTPLAVDPAHPFPFLSNLSVSIGVRLRKPDSPDTHFARLKIPDVLPQWFRVSLEGQTPLRLCRLQDLILAHLPHFFPEMLLEATTGFRVLRSADTEQVIEEADDLLDMVEEELRLRRMAEIVALQHLPGSDPWFQRMLGGELGLEAEDLYPSPGELNFLALGEIASLPFPQHRFTPWQPLTPSNFAGDDSDIFRVLRDHDELLHLPYESFQSSVERLIRAAARDEQVLAVKIALYRLGDDSPLIPLLIEAALKGKQVVCVVELKARFDEARNIYWSEQLEKAGVHVVYGVVGLKTHAKIALVVRREQDGYRFYGHVGTGNYNPGTAKLYSDFGLFSSDRKITQEMIEIFNYLTGLSLNRRYENFLLAPVNMRSRFTELIDREIAHAGAGRAARIVAKMNSLEDPLIIEKLYQASQAGVGIDLTVRGFCCLRPGVPGLSERIRVRSVVGRFLEHSRLYTFANGHAEQAEGDFFIGSADWMSRNLNNRVEAIVPILSQELKQGLWDVMQLYLADSAATWELEPEGQYRRLFREDSGPSVQDLLMQQAHDRHLGKREPSP
jgi:polyphosphate kinase